MATLPVVIGACSAEITHADKVVSPGLLVMIMIYVLGDLSGVSKLVLESPMQELFEGELEFNAIISLLQEPVSIVGQSHHRQCGRIC